MLDTLLWIPPAVLATHLTEIIRDHAHELLGRQEVKRCSTDWKQEYPAVVDELIPNLLSIGEVQKVLQNLLREGGSNSKPRYHFGDPCRHGSYYARVQII